MAAGWRVENEFDCGQPMIVEPRGIKAHSRFIQKEMLSDAAPEIAVRVGANPYYTWFVAAMAPRLSALVEKVNPVFWQGRWREG
jgi:hypothetical protein